MSSGSLKVAIVHYHLERGGVTRIIEVAYPHFKAANIDALILTGKPYEGSLNLPTTTVPSLGYSSDEDQISPQTLADLIEQAAKEHFGSAPDVFHFHNHALGKNSALPDAIYILAKKGYPMLLHIHDFAEDCRPLNYQHVLKNLSSPGALYPISPRIHYATVNLRDQDFLHSAGTPKSNLHHIANPINKIATTQESVPNFLKSKKLFLYVTRGIRRKNIGELLLWSCMDNANDALYATTLTPTNPKAKPIHERWKRLAKELGLPIQLGITDDPDSLSFSQAIHAANTFITTSIAEGFGMAFLEPWLLHKPVVGRDIPDITSDFSAHGINLSHLYKRLEVPQNLLPAGALETTLRKSLDKFYNEYSTEQPKNALDLALDSIVQADKVDFGRLDESLQETIIKAVAASTEIKTILRNHNALTSPTDAAIQECAQLVEKNYCPEHYCKNLFETYKTIASADQEDLDFMNPEGLLAQFLDPRRFSLLRN